MSRGYVAQAATGMCTRDTVKTTGLNIWVSGENSPNRPEVDVIAVQGLGAHAYYTWVWKSVSTEKVKPKIHHPLDFLRGRQKNAQADELPDVVQTASDTAEVMWLRDFLPYFIPNARIATYSYESDWRRADVKTNLRKCGEQLLEVLRQNRSSEKERQRPLIFIGHSLGGLIIKQALVVADHGNDSRDIRLSTAGIIFLGTPHQGSEAAVYGVRLAQAVGHDKMLLESLKRNSPALYDIARDFEASYRNADIVCFYEDKEASYGPWRTQFADRQSAVLHGKRAIYLSTDHSGLNKFRGPKDDNFLLVRPEIERMVQMAPQRIEKCLLEAQPAARDREQEFKDRKQEFKDREQEFKDREQEFKDRKRATIIGWLSPLTFRERQSQLYNQCTQQNVSTPSSLESSEFAAWTSGGPWKLQCVGKPGAGKTFVCALAVERLKTIFRCRDVPILCIYLNYKESNVQTLDNLISSLLKQLLQHPNAEFKSPEAKRLFSRVENESRPTLEDFYEAFLAEIRHHERVMIVVDAYDEAPLDVQARLTDRLGRLSTEKASLMITSRSIEDEEGSKYCDICGRGKPNFPPLPPPKLYHRCETCEIDICSECRTKDVYCRDREHKLEKPEVRMRIEPSDDDIRTYVQKELETELRLGSSKHSNSTTTKSSFGTTRLGRICQSRPDLQERIIPIVVSGADSMFTLAGLYMQNLRACISEADVEDALDHSPEGYDAFYKRNMQRITEESENPRASTLARRTLAWVVHAYRPLSLGELKDALAVDLSKSGFRKAARPEKATILEVTAGMIMIDPDEESVRLIHHTAQEYFNKSRDDWFAGAPASLTRVLLHYMSLGELTKPCGGIYEDKDFDARRKAYPLLEYAYPYWGDHACEAGLHSETQVAILQYVRDPDKIAAWTQAAWYLRSAENAEWDIHKGANALHVCAWFGLTDVVSRLLEEGLDVNAADPTSKQTPLMYACRRGKSATVAKLLESGADINHYSQRDSALFEAIDNGAIETVDLLLANRTLDVNAIHPWRNNCTALMLAAQGGKLQIVNALLDRPGTRLDHKDSFDNTVLSIATIAGEYKIVDTLLKHEGIGINSQNKLGGTALILAATTSGGRKEAEAGLAIAMPLLEQGANSSIKDKEGGTAILRAVDAGNKAMVTLLLEYKANMDIRDHLNRGLLHSAAINGYEEIVELLLEKGLEVDTQDQNGKTPLHDAGRNGNYKVARQLLNSGADQSIKDKQGRTPWTVAWQYGHPNVMRILGGEDIREEKIEQDSYPQVHLLPIWSLVNLRFEQGVKEMIATKPNEIYFCDPDMGNTALHCAINANNPTILTLLLRAGLSPDALNDRLNYLSKDKEVAYLVI